MTRLKHKPPVANIKDLVYLGQVVGSGISRAAQEPRTCIQVERQRLHLHAPRGLQDCHRLLGQGSYHTSASLLTCDQNQTCRSSPPAALQAPRSRASLTHWAQFTSVPPHCLRTFACAGSSTWDSLLVQPALTHPSRKHSPAGPRPSLCPRPPREDVWDCMFSIFGYMITRTTSASLMPLSSGQTRGLVQSSGTLHGGLIYPPRKPPQHSDVEQSPSCQSGKPQKPAGRNPLPNGAHTGGGGWRSEEIHWVLQTPAAVTAPSPG